jgi:hypothetical protein
MGREPFVITVKDRFIPIRLPARVEKAQELLITRQSARLPQSGLLDEFVPLL